MNLLDWLLGRPKTLTWGDPWNDDVNTVLVSTYGMPDQERILPQFDAMANAYAGNSGLFSLVARRLNLFSEATFKFRSLKDKRLFGGKGLARLERPWPNGTTGELLARMEQDVSLVGNFYLRDAGDRLERLRPDWVTIVSEVTRDKQGRQVREVVGYLYEPVGDPDRSTELYLVDEVAHWSPIPDPTANFRGMSWMTSVLREVDADIAMTAHKDAFFRNAASPNMVIKYQQRLGADQRARIRDAVAAKHAGSRNAFGTLVLDQGADLTVVGDRMQGSAFAEVQAIGERRLAAAAGVPLLVAGFESLASGASEAYVDAIRALVDLTLRPNWRSACACLEKFAAPPGDAQLWYDTSDISALRPGEKDQADTMSTQASTANTLIMAGYEPDAVVAAVTAGDLTILEGRHSGLTSVQMHKPGDAEPADDKPAASDKESGRAESHGKGAALREYWTKNPEGLAKWVDKPHPWYALYHEILKHVPDEREAREITSRWFIDVFHHTPNQGHHRADMPHSQAMVALVPSTSDARRLAVDGGELAEDLHCTLMFLGPAEGFGHHARAMVSGAVMAVAEKFGPVDADGFAVSLFNPSSDESCVVLGVGGEGLTAVHGAAVEAVSHVLDVAGVGFPAQRTPWIPHVTLAYGDDISADGLRDRTGPLTFNRLRVAFGTSIVDVPLVG